MPATEPSTPEESGLPPDLRAALFRYRTMSYVVGVMLLLLVCVAVPLQYAWSRPALADVVAPLHGILYIVYLVTAADLARRARFSVAQLFAVVCAGFLPGLAFVVERRTTARIARTWS
jgi:integral membrane protein